MLPRVVRGRGREGFIPCLCSSGKVYLRRSTARNDINATSSRIFSTTLQTHGLPSAAAASHVMKPDLHYPGLSIHAPRNLSTLGGFCSENRAHTNPTRAVREKLGISGAILSASLTGSVLGLTSIYQREWKVPRAKLTPIKRHRRVVLLDEKGNNLGEMESKIAQGLAEGNGLTVVEVKDTNKTEKYPVFKMISKRELSEEEKTKRVLAKQKKKLETFKEFKLGTRISDHDMDVKIRNIRNVLMKGVTVRVTMEAKRRKGMSEEMFVAEQGRRSVMLGDITKKLRDVAAMSSKKPNKVKKGDVMAEYKPMPQVEGVESAPQKGVESASQKEVESASQKEVESASQKEVESSRSHESQRVESTGAESLAPEEEKSSHQEEGVELPPEGVEPGEETSPIKL